MRIRNLSIRSRLALLILTASVLAVVLASIGFAIYERHSERAGAVQEVTALADTLGANSAASLAFNDPATAQQMLSAIATEPHILIAALYDNSDRIFAVYRRSRGGDSHVLPARLPDGAYFGRTSLTLSRGVYLNGERTGSIVLIFDLSQFRARLVGYARIASLVLLTSVLCTFLISLGLARSIGNPLVHLATIARRISAEKDYSVRAIILAGAETGLLITSFNEMLSQIETREQALKVALESLQESEERYALAARGANDGLWDWNLESNRIYFSPRWDLMLGYPVGGLWSGPEDWFSHVHGDDRERVRAEIAAHCKGETPEFASEYRMQHKSGRYIWTLSRGLAVRDEHGRAVRMAGSQTDITEGKTADPLTRIPNRLYFIDRLQSAIEAARQSNIPFAVLFIDLDLFKLVNDSMGHAAGDEVLIDVTGRLRASIRTTPQKRSSEQSVVARIGGDEFAILLNQVQHDGDASIVATRILERLNEPFYIEGRRLFVSASIGIALDSCGATPEDLLRNADTAMYHAKAKGKARFEYFNDGLRERVITRFETESGLRKAVAEQQLVVYYQPIVSLIDSRIRGFEALVRWNHPERGLVPPGEFIPIAEESDIILHLGRWVLGEACRQTAEWQSIFAPVPPLSVSVNVSSRQLADPRFAEDVESALNDSGLDPEALALEITESSIMGNAEQTLATLNRLKAMNVRLEIDDFGTGYSSLSYLQRLPFDALKIDRSFILEMGAGNGSFDIVRAIVQLARSLKLDLIAEGVETADQLGQLSDLGCDLCQGYLISKPVPSEAAQLLFREGWRSRSLSGVGGLSVKVEADTSGVIETAIAQTEKTDAIVSGSLMG
jgi:diguanylate cyclase (GGDEF)-like protein/PAS domain S-box-containing protein